MSPLPLPGDNGAFKSHTPGFSSDRGFSPSTRLGSRWTLVKGCLLHSRSASPPSDRAPFVLIHGLVISSLYMIPLAEAIAERHEVHALDLPGFGKSEGPARTLTIPELADAVLDWMDKTGIQRCHLIANSLGCQVAAHVAVKDPGRIATVVLMGPTVDPSAFNFLVQTLRLLHDALHEPPALWMKWIFDLIRAGLRRAIGTTREMFRDHIECQLPLITAPTLIIRGGIDPTLPASAAVAMTRLLLRGELLVFEHEPHCVHYTQPQVVCRVVVAHAVSPIANYAQFANK